MPLTGLSGTNWLMWSVLPQSSSGQASLLLGLNGTTGGANKWVAVRSLAYNCCVQHVGPHKQCPLADRQLAWECHVQEDMVWASIHSRAGQAPTQVHCTRAGWFSLEPGVSCAVYGCPGSQLPTAPPWAVQMMWSRLCMAAGALPQKSRGLRPPPQPLPTAVLGL